MKFCKFCGAQLKDEAKFCPKCGKAQSIASANQGQSTSQLSQLQTPKPQTVQIPMQQQQPVTNQLFAKNNMLHIGIGVVAALVIVVCAYLVLGSSIKTKTATAPAVKTETTAKTETNSVAPEPTAKVKVDAKSFITTMQHFEERLAEFAARINGGQDNKSVLLDVGQALKEDINRERNQLRKLDNDTTVQRLDQLLNIQWKRADCMVRGLNGQPGAYAEGGSYYDDFQAKFTKFKQDIGV